MDKGSNSYWNPTESTVNGSGCESDATVYGVDIFALPVADFTWDVPKFLAGNLGLLLVACSSDAIAFEARVLMLSTGIGSSETDGGKTFRIHTTHMKAIGDFDVTLT